MLRKNYTRRSRRKTVDADEVKAKLKDRQAAIVAALRRCMLSKGYAETSLTDLAKSAGMSVSHLLYYFPSKEAALEELCAEVTNGLLSEIVAYKDEPVEERIHVLADHIFMRNVVARSELGIALELIALSLHRPKISKKLKAYSGTMISYLTDLFRIVPRQPGMSAEDTAEIAAAIWMGLFTNFQYDSQLDDGRARRLFRRSLFALANIQNHDSPTARVTSAAPKTRAMILPIRRTPNGSAET
jgi:AcrR family transcriptional regulator